MPADLQAVPCDDDEEEQEAARARAAAAIQARARGRASRKKIGELKKQGFSESQATLDALQDQNATIVQAHVRGVQARRSVEISLAAGDLPGQKRGVATPIKFANKLSAATRIILASSAFNDAGDRRRARRPAFSGPLPSLLSGTAIEFLPTARQVEIARLATVKRQQRAGVLGNVSIFKPMRRGGTTSTSPSRRRLPATEQTPPPQPPSMPPPRPPLPPPPPMPHRLLPPHERRAHLIPPPRVDASRPSTAPTTTAPTSTSRSPKVAAARSTPNTKAHGALVEALLASSGSTASAAERLRAARITMLTQNPKRPGPTLARAHSMSAVWVVRLKDV